MYDNMRVSDADRERVAGRLREHFAEGRLTSDELDERLSAALRAKTVGDLRAVMADLPEPVPAGMGAGQVPPPGPQGWQGPPPQWGARGYYRRGPRLLPIVLLLIFAGLVLPGVGWGLFALLKIVLVFWLVSVLIGVFTARRVRSRSRRWQSGYDDRSQRYGPWS